MSRITQHRDGLRKRLIEASEYAKTSHFIDTQDAIEDAKSILLDEVDRLLKPPTISTPEDHRFVYDHARGQQFCERCGVARPVQGAGYPPCVLPGAQK